MNLQVVDVAWWWVTRVYLYKSISLSDSLPSWDVVVFISRGFWMKLERAAIDIWLSFDYCMTSAIQRLGTASKSKHQNEKAGTFTQQTHKSSRSLKYSNNEQNKTLSQSQQTILRYLWLWNTYRNGSLIGSVATFFPQSDKYIQIFHSQLQQ